MSEFKLIDNKRIFLANVLRSVAPNHKFLSVATGYWDLEGTLEIIEQIKDYKSIRLLIGKEPLSKYNQKAYNIQENLFPDDDISFDLAETPTKIKDESYISQLRQTSKIIADLLDKEILKVKVFRKPFLHAKTYIFGNKESSNAVGIVGSSNFTKAGLTNNAELNTFEDDYRIVTFQPQADNQGHGHLSWFDELWKSPEAIDWTGDFTKILRNSPVGDLTFGCYDVYIKTLMELFPEELEQKQILKQDINDVLYSFQNRNACLLLSKLERMGLAMLSDSVGLGKTITAGAVIKTYVEKGAKRIIVIVPASLKQQWEQDLGEHFKLTEGVEYKLVSQQDVNKIEEMIEWNKKPWIRPVDLFVIDEAHNLRNKGSERYKKILEWLQLNKDSKVLLLTATPVNNGLMDLANQIQLASKGALKSVLVEYKENRDKIIYIDFFESLKIIQSRINKAEKKGNKILQEDWEDIQKTVAQGVSYYLVRSTRQGVENEGGIISNDGNKKVFPQSSVKSIEYEYSEDITNLISTKITENLNVFENINPKKINLDAFSEITQQSSHPLDFIKQSTNTEDYIEISPFDETANLEIFNRIPESEKTLLSDNEIKDIITNIFQIVNLLGFVPYRPEIYQNQIYGKSIKEISELLSIKKSEDIFRIRTQLAVHNILHITWLKRLESSSKALLQSILNYERYLNKFYDWLQKGYIVSLKDISLLENFYGDDIEKAFEDWENYDSDNEDMKKGVEKKEADANIYNLKAMKKDVKRDIKIIEVLKKLLTELSTPKNNGKLLKFVKLLKAIDNNKFGKKVLVFSFFADTINYLKDSLPNLLKNEIPNFNEESGFISGQTAHFNDVVNKFSPKSKKYNLKPGEKEINYLFATDVLSEGQNLQDSAVLVNYDLHWNPVRMIQRNGRINRLGSEFEEVFIANMKPIKNLELYLNLVRRLEKKIDTIKHTVGTDQSVLGEKINPIEFIEQIYSTDFDKVKSVMSELEEQNDILSWTNNYVFDLRKFLKDNENNKKYIKYIQKIPLEKWNYLPDENKTKAKDIFSLALIRTLGKTSITNKEINELFFAGINEQNQAFSMEREESLGIIKTTSDNNTKHIDNIKLQRYLISRLAKKVTKDKAEKPNIYNFTPSQLKAIIALQQFYPNISLQHELSKGIQNSAQVTKITQILRKVNNEIKEKNTVSLSTYKEFDILFNEICNSQIEEKQITDTIGVLYYAFKH
ncbi:SNF2-related protein [Candidatus Ruminimicrobium bovinum]|uniref:SNF2-related protein n=1 Tax=Candidatus Ruminimicrobium bovinum TaxID=3242779 RepID=UPI0039B99C98